LKIAKSVKLSHFFKDAKEDKRKSLCSQCKPKMSCEENVIFASVLKHLTSTDMSKSVTEKGVSINTVIQDKFDFPGSKFWGRPL